MSIMTLGIPLILAVIVFIIEAVVCFTIFVGVIMVCFNQPMEQIKCKLGKRDTLFTIAGHEMWIEAGVKENKTDVMYKKQGKKGFANHIDLVRYIVNSFTKWGKSKVLFYYPGKAWPKTISQIAATQRVWEIASIHISKDKKIPNQLLSIAGHKLMHTRKLKEILDSLGITAPFYAADPDAVLQYNEYLCLIAESDKNKALELIRMYQDLELPNPTEREEAKATLEATAEQYIVLPEKQDKNALTTDKIKEIRSQLLEEVRMVREFCKELLVPPTVVALGEFMSAYPDKSTNDIILNDIQGTCEQKAAANEKGSLDIKWVVAGMIGEAGIFMILFIVIFALLK